MGHNLKKEKNNDSFRKRGSYLHSSKGLNTGTILMIFLIVLLLVKCIIYLMGKLYGYIFSIS